MGILVFEFVSLLSGSRYLRSRYLHPRLQTIVNQENLEETFKDDSVIGALGMSICIWGFSFPLMSCVSFG